MKITDEIINKYIDGELSGEELKEFLSESSLPDVQLRIRSMQRASDAFKKNVTEYSAPAGFTQRLMLHVNKKYKPRKSDSFFILSVSSVFILLTFIIMGFLLSHILGTEGTPSLLYMSESISILLGKISRSLIAMFSSNGISVIGGVISLGLIISGLFYFDYLKNTR